MTAKQSEEQLVQGSKKVDDVDKDGVVEDDEKDDSDDEDYVPDNDNGEGSESEDEESGVISSGKKRKVSEIDEDLKETFREIKRANYSKIESSDGGLIKTRQQRLREANDNHDKHAMETLNGNQTETLVDIDSIWSEMKQTGAKSVSPSVDAVSSTSLEQQIAEQPVEKIEQEKIKITRTYEYAGDTITENKWVLKSSAEAKAYLTSIKLEGKSAPGETVAAANSRSGKPLRKRRAKKSSIVDDIIKNSKMARINTLEKSRLDWANYVDSNKLNDELKKHNKDGYLSKQDFLNKVEHNIDYKIKEGKKLQ